MWIVAISVCSAITMILVLVLCSCWKRERQKSEWLGLDGMVTQMNPDENVNHLPSATTTTTLQCVPNSCAAGDDIDSSKRSNAAAAAANNPTRRSLPDIPSEQIKIEGNNITWSEQTGDNSSELYATVEQCQNTVKRQVLPNGVESRPSISQHSSLSQADDGPYAKLNYKVHKLEHPYARVQSITNNEIDENSSDEAVLLRPSTSQSCAEPVAPPRSRRTSVHSNIDIPAASAVAGGIAANQELPYMTPPITQPNFSGDSQDSSKGYTSISVREPLANIRAQTKEINKLQRDVDPHYSTVSDDSDEMYTTIQDPNNQLYMSGSETYAQIQPVALTVVAEVNPVPSSTNVRIEEDEVGDGLYEPAPQPPSVDSLKHVAHSHSRQASSSSSVGALGSPKPEKRQANSPLPPPPSISPDLHERSKNIDDMYAKVHKNRKKLEDDLQRSSERASVRSSRKSSSSPSQEKKIYEEEEASTSSKFSEDKKYVRKEHNYETLKKQFQEADYEKLKREEPGYASINGPDSLLSTDPGYEILKQQSAANSDIDPNYERIRHRTDSAGYSTIKEAITDTYSVIDKQRKLEDRLARVNYESRDFSSEEPNYESMPSEAGFEHNYAALLKSTDSECDPNYESVTHSDPNYESVKYLDVEQLEPPYEKLNEDDSAKTDDSRRLEKKDSNPGYETIDTSNSSTREQAKAEPPYERLHNEDSSSKTDSEFSGYEKIQNKSQSESNDNQIPGYETIKPKDLHSSGNQSKSASLYSSINKEKSGTNTSDDLPNSDEEIFEV